MSARLRRGIAVLAVVTHLWVNFVVSPWHHLVAHRGDGQPAGSAETTKPQHRRCHCRHHAHCHPASVSARSAGDPQPTPLAPHDEDECPVCQSLAQPVAPAQVPVPPVVHEPREFIPSVSTVQPWLGCLIDPVSRGPPSAV